jgi:hypothetical protein
MGRISIGTNKAVTISMKGARHGALVFQCLETFFYGSIACPRGLGPYRNRVSFQVSPGTTIVPNQRSEAVFDRVATGSRLTPGFPASGTILAFDESFQHAPEADVAVYGRQQRALGLEHAKAMHDTS